MTSKILGISLALVILLGSVSTILPADATFCSGRNPLNELLSRNILNEKTIHKEFALVLVTITDKELTDQKGGWYSFANVTYNIDEIKYVDGAKSNILKKHDTLSLRQNLADNLKVGEQYITVYVKYEKYDWRLFLSNCTYGIYSTGVIDYMKWLNTEGNLINHYPRFDLFEIKSPQIFDSKYTVTLGDKIFIGTLSNVTTIEKVDGQYIDPKKVLTFDVTHDYYNAYTKVIIDHPAWLYNYEMTDPKEGNSYFVYIENSRIKWLIPLEDAFEFVNPLYSSDTHNQIYFLEVVYPKLSLIRAEISSNDILSKKISISEFPRAFPIHVTFTQMNQEIADEWNVLLEKYQLDELDDNQISYSVKSNAPQITKHSDDVTWRDFLIPSIQDQLSWKIHPFDINCGQINLVILPDGSPDCVSEDIAQKMLKDNTAIMQIKPTTITP